MEFQVTEKLLIEDAAAVQMAIERHLRATFQRVERYSSQILLFSTQDPSDFTVVEAFEEHGHTTVTAFGSYLASGLPDDAAQAAAVEASLDSALDQVIEELKIRRLEPRAVTYNDVGYPKLFEPATNPPETFAAEANVSEEAPEPETQWNLPSDSEPSLNHRADSGTPRTRQGWMELGIGFAVVSAALVVLALNLLNPGSGPAIMKDAVDSSPAKVQPDVSPGPSPYVFDPGLAVKPETDLTAWVQDWADSLRSRDPQSQGSYYFATVDNYLGARAVSRDFVIQEKMADLRQRQRLSTIKVEQVHIEKQSPSEAVLRAVRHTISQSPTEGLSETFVKIKLKLRNDGSVWQIVDEQNLGNAGVITSKLTNQGAPSRERARPGGRGRRTA